MSSKEEVVHMNSAVTVEGIQKRIFLLREQKIMLDSDLAELYGVETKTFNRAVKRNRDRFPDDFMFQLQRKEYDNLKSHFGTSSWGGRQAVADWPQPEDVDEVYRSRP